MNDARELIQAYGLIASKWVYYTPVDDDKNSVGHLTLICTKTDHVFLDLNYENGKGWGWGAGYGFTPSLSEAVDIRRGVDGIEYPDVPQRLVSIANFAMEL